MGNHYDIEDISHYGEIESRGSLLLMGDAVPEIPHVSGIGEPVYDVYGIHSQRTEALVGIVPYCTSNSVHITSSNKHTIPMYSKLQFRCFVFRLPSLVLFSLTGILIPILFVYTSRLHCDNWQKCSWLDSTSISQVRAHVFVTVYDTLWHHLVLRLEWAQDSMRKK